MAIKSIKLDNIAGRVALLVVGAFCILGVYFIVKWCLGNTLATNLQYRDIAELAVNLAPDDPKAHYNRAAMLEKTFLNDDLPQSLKEYEEATSLSPNDFRMWFDLGRARNQNGDQAGAEKAFRKASEMAPNYSRVHWSLGNLLLRQGRTDEAFVEIRKAVENDPSYANPAVAVAWQFFDADVPLISQKIGDSVPIKSALSTFLAREKRFDEAFTLWNALPEIDKKETYKNDSQQLLQSLIEYRKFRAAFAVQSQIAEPEGEKFEIGKVFNGGFESDIKTANASFFEWSITDVIQPQIGFDDKQKHGGNRSLVVVFNSQTGQEFRAISQNVAVEGGKRYTFQTFFRSDLKTSPTVRWDIIDPYDGKVLASTEPVPTSSDWAPLTVQFTTAPTTEAVAIRFVRVPCQASAAICPISGRVWFDDFNLKKSE